MKKVGILMGSDSDLPVVEKAVDTLKDPSASLTRCTSTPHTERRSRFIEFTAQARENGFGVLIAAAGKAAHSGRIRCGGHYAAGDRHPDQVLHPRRT